MKISDINPDVTPQKDTELTPYEQTFLGLLKKIEENTRKV